MRSVLRVLALMVLFVFIAANGRTAFAGGSPPLNESKIRFWSDRWMTEIERQSLPTPQLLYIESRLPKAHLIKMEPMDESLESMAALKIAEDRPLNVKKNFNTLYNGLPEAIRHRALLSVTAFIPPPQTKPTDTGTNRELSWARLQLGDFVSHGLAELYGLRPPQEDRKTLLLRRNNRSFASIGPTVFSEEQFGEANPFKLNIPKRLSVYGDDLRLFEDSVNRMLNDPSLLLLDQGGMSWTMLFFRWSPPEQDEMFSTLLPHSP